MAAGSLFGVALHEGTSFPVGKVDFMDLYPLTFQEFLCALGEERFVNILQGTDTDMVRTFKSGQRDTEESVELLSTGFFKTRRDFIGSKTESCMEFDSDAAGEGK